MFYTKGKAFFILVVSIVFSSCGKKAQFPIPSAGVYSNGLIVAYDAQTTEWSGIYRKKDCWIYIVGKWDGDKMNTVSFHPTKKIDRTFGVLEITNKDKLHLQFEKEHPFCDFGEGYSPTNGKSFELKSPRDWIRLRTVKADTSYLYEDHHIKSPKLVVLPKHSVLKVINKGIHWDKVQYETTDSLRTGFVQVVDLIRFPG